MAAQLILISAGYIHRKYPSKLKSITSTPSYLNGISNRLAAQSPRSTFLGMVVGEALSGLTDHKGLVMDFTMEELKSDEAKWWKGLVNVADEVGSIEGLRGTDRCAVVDLLARPSLFIDPDKLREGEDEEQMLVHVVKGKFEDSDSLDEEFQPYPKPDSDAEDSDDDPTLVTRKKESAPVYIRDLLRLLKSDEYEKMKLALTHASILIRKKSFFGSELADHVYELAASLAGLQDKYDVESFQEMKMQALISLVVAMPEKLGPWIAQAFFEGEFSIGQRAVLLTAMGLGARELAGFKDESLPLSDESGKGNLALASSTGAQGEMFPTKKLPGQLHELYSSKSARAIEGDAAKVTKKLDAITSEMEKMMIQPMAMEAADQLSGPNVLKVRTFSSRMAVEKKKGKPLMQRLGKVVGDAFFFPLTARWWVKLKELYVPLLAIFHTREIYSRKLT